MAPTPRPEADRFWEKVNKTPTCWLWAGAIDSNGYGNFWTANGRYVKAHRWAFVAVRGLPPTGSHLDHLCRVHNCVRPDHLDPVSLVENLLRGDTTHRGQWQRERTHCPRNHAYDEANTYRTKDGRRICRSCNRERMHERRQQVRSPR